MRTSSDLSARPTKIDTSVQRYIDCGASPSEFVDTRSISDRCRARKLCVVVHAVWRQHSGSPNEVVLQVNELTCQGPGLADIGFFWLGLVGAIFVWWCESHGIRKVWHGALPAAGIGVEHVSSCVRNSVCAGAPRNRRAIEVLPLTNSFSERGLVGGG